jgi:hypothetical protein
MANVFKGCARVELDKFSSNGPSERMSIARRDEARYLCA